MDPANGVTFIWSDDEGMALLFDGDVFRFPDKSLAI